MHMLRNTSAPSFAVTGVAAVAAAVIAGTPNVVAPAAHTAESVPVSLSGAAESMELGPALSALQPDMFDAVDPSSAGTSIGDGIESFYNSVEPGIQYAFSFVSYLIGWIPVVGLAAPQINFFYDLAESAVHTLLFNTVDVLDGSVDFDQGLDNVGADLSEAFNDFADTEQGWIRHFFPPPLPGTASAEDPTDLFTATPDASDPTAATDPSALFDLGAP
jgi:hypothetical protein